MLNSLIRYSIVNKMCTKNALSAIRICTCLLLKSFRTVHFLVQQRLVPVIVTGYAHLTRSVALAPLFPTSYVECARRTHHVFIYADDNLLR